MRVGRRAALVLGATLLLGACGGTSRGDLDDEIRARGGGLGADLAVDAIEAIEEELGEEPVLRRLSLTVALASVEVLVPGTDDEVDSYRYGTSGLYGIRGLDGPEPVSGVEPPAELRRTLFRPDRVALEDLDAIVDEAIEVADLEDGYAQGASVYRLAGERPRITVTVANERANVAIQFRGDGTLLPGQGGEPR